MTVVALFAGTDDILTTENVKNGFTNVVKLCLPDDGLDLYVLGAGRIKSGLVLGYLVKTSAPRS